jgi:hypothetical protein
MSSRFARAWPSSQKCIRPGFNPRGLKVAFDSLTGTCEVEIPD